jgi:triosephosphate isomerase
MKHIFVNLKRFDVARELGGVCPEANPVAWVRSVMTSVMNNGAARRPDMTLTIMLPEALLVPAVETVRELEPVTGGRVAIGCQSVHRENVARGGNFGAMTTFRPAVAMKQIGASWTIIGHCEERRGYGAILSACASDGAAISRAVDGFLRQSLDCALASGLKVLFCVGETAEEKGEGDLECQKPRIREVLARQLRAGLSGLDEDAVRNNLCVAYEPVWAIGPGKVPPHREYVAFVAKAIGEISAETTGIHAQVVYGGGLKKENAAMIGSIGELSGGLVALTRFTGDIGFYPDELAEIMALYSEACV